MSLTSHSEFLNREYLRLWEDYGLESVPVPPVAIEEARPRPVPEGESPFFIVVEGPPAPVVAFVVQMPKEYQRLKKEDEALWERMLQALTFHRDDIALVKIFKLDASPDAALPHFFWALPQSVRRVVFFGASPFQTVTAAAPQLGAWSSYLDDAQGLQGEWLVTHDLGTLTRDPNSKKETWNHLKDLPQRLK